MGVGVGEIVFPQPLPTGNLDNEVRAGISRRQQWERLAGVGLGQGHKVHCDLRVGDHVTIPGTDTPGRHSVVQTVTEVIRESATPTSSAPPQKMLGPSFFPL